MISATVPRACRWRRVRSGNLVRVAQVDAAPVSSTARSASRLGDDQAAAADAEIERLVQVAPLLLEHVAPGDAERRRRRARRRSGTSVSRTTSTRSPAPAVETTSRREPSCDRRRDRCRRARTARSPRPMRRAPWARARVIMRRDRLSSTRASGRPWRVVRRRRAFAASSRCARSRDRGGRRAAPRSCPRRPGRRAPAHADARRSVAITVAPVSLVGAAHDRGAPVDVDVGAHARQLAARACSGSRRSSR